MRVDSVRVSKQGEWNTLHTEYGTLLATEEINF